MKALVRFLFLWTLGSVTALAQPAPIAGGKWIDLSHDFSVETIYWPTARRFELAEVAHGMTGRGYFYASNDYSASEHGGTHIDAPIHFAEGKRTVDEIPLGQLMGMAVVVDVSEAALADRDYLVSVSDFERWEAQHGRLADGQIVFLRTGYGRFWPDPEKYMGTSERGDSAVAKLHFPGLSPEAARWLVENRSISAVGLDTPSIDYGQSTLFEAHRTLFAANIPALENVANLDKLPATGSWVIALPMKIKGGSGGPVRIAAHLPD